MDAQIIVLVAGLVLLLVIIASLIFLRGYSGKYTYDMANGTRPRASEGEGNTLGVTFKGRFRFLMTGVGAMFAALTAKLWSMQMVSSDYYDTLSQQNQTRTVRTSAPRGRILDRNGNALVTNRPSLAVTAYRDLADDTVLVRHLSNVLGIPYVAALRNIQDNTEGAQARHTIATGWNNRDRTRSLCGGDYARPVQTDEIVDSYSASGIPALMLLFPPEMK